MKIKVQVIIEAEEGENALAEEVACLERNDLKLETLGLSLAEAKALLSNLQKTLLTQQTQHYLEQHRCCPQCQTPFSRKATHNLVMRSLFGKFALNSPQLYTCKCQSLAENRASKASFSPLAHLLPERSTPELVYLETKWASSISYGLTSDLLSEVLPLSKPISTASLTRQVHKVAQRLETELGEEQVVFIEGCQQQWNELPEPAEPIVMGIEGGYVRARSAEQRQDGSFEVIVGKSLAGQGDSKCFGFVTSYDTKPKRRVFETLRSQGMQPNQQVTFLSDGGDNVRQLQLYLNPQSEFLLDWVRRGAHDSIPG
jgi:hypothetical protein